MSPRGPRKARRDIEKAFEDAKKAHDLKEEGRSPREIAEELEMTDKQVINLRRNFDQLHDQIKGDWENGHHRCAQERLNTLRMVQPKTEQLRLWEWTADYDSVWHDLLNTDDRKRFARARRTITGWAEKP